MRYRIKPIDFEWHALHITSAHVYKCTRNKIACRLHHHTFNVWMAHGLIVIRMVSLALHTFLIWSSRIFFVRFCVFDIRWLQSRYNGGYSQHFKCTPNQEERKEKKRQITNRTNKWLKWKWETKRTNKHAKQINGI